jgi:NADH:ubiquinone oxidoreductase subunit 6 (subunit J)
MLFSLLLIILIIIQGILVIVSKNSVASILYLIGVYILTSICFMILGAEFLSIIL